MRITKFIQKPKLFYMIFILSVFLFLASAVDVDSKASSESKSPSYKEIEELSQLKESTLQQRNELINKLINIIKEDRFKYSGTYTAIDILGQIRANEAVGILLDKADYHAPVTSLVLATRHPLVEFVRSYPAVKALINIHPPYEIILREIVDVNNVNLSCYVAILVGMEGEEVSRFIIEKAIEKESDERKLTRLNYALNMINEDVPLMEESESGVTIRRQRKVNNDGSLKNK